jgi:hypothetical protein
LATHSARTGDTGNRKFQQENLIETYLSVSDITNIFQRNRMQICKLDLSGTMTGCCEQGNVLYLLYHITYNEYDTLSCLQQSAIVLCCLRSFLLCERDVLFRDMSIFVLCLIVVPLPPGKYQFTVQ